MYLLILGSPRSGTTLLASMIGTHTEVAMLIEDRNFAIKKLTSKKILGNKLCLPNQIDLNKRATSFSLLLKNRFGIKSYPTSKYNIEDYLNLKDLKIINIVRDYNDVIYSNIKRGEGGKKRKIEQDKAVQWWSRAVEVMYELSQKHSEKVITVSYEDLVREPEKILRKISNYIDIEFQEKMLEGYKFTKLYPNETGIDKTRAFKTTAMENKYPSLSPKAAEAYQNLIKLKVNP